MKFMITWKIPPATYRAAMERYAKTGGPVPSGLKQIGRWHVAGSSTGFSLVEGSEAAANENIAQWADVAELTLTPVLEDAEANITAQKLFGK
jgi:hypothetical protein